MADVAAVTLAMWDEVLGERARQLVCEGLALERSQAGRWVAFVAGCHDLGKCSRNFQGMLDGWKERLTGTGMTGIEKQAEPRHGTVTSAFLPPMLEERYAMERALAIKLSTVTGGHHGRFEVARPDHEGPRIGEGRGQSEAPLWAGARSAIVDELSDVLDVLDPAPSPLTNRAAIVLAGLISVADWIGSDESFFPYSPGDADDLAAYFAYAQGRAGAALKGLHWKDWVAPPPGRRFAELFPFPPNALQDAMDNAVPDDAGLVIVEAPMGDGKTEAAFLKADRWNAAGARGLYVALPTQATANQMHGRLAAMLRKLYSEDDVNLVLAHGGAAFVENDDVQLLPTNIDGHDEEATVGAGEWFVKGNKRRLLAPYAVGTIDQSLLAVLQVKHVFVRLFALAGKAVIIDEVHAYDAYMNTLLERLLEWLGALDSPVVLLSATLPKSRRQSLMKAYLAGQQGVPPETIASGGWTDARYPRITWTGGYRVEAAHVEASERSRRVLQLKYVEDDACKVRELLLSKLASGGCAAVICNTVKCAQEMYTALATSFGEHELGLFHARFVQEDRQRIEDECLQRFGPPSDGEPTDRPRPRYVLVATQVIEQSLDLDFDVMVSDPAPADLLLQRSGRMQRHAREWRPGPPELHIRWPEEQDGAPRFDGGTATVYDEHILLRTWLALRDRDQVAIPDDVETLIEQVYGDGHLPGDATATLRDMWHRTLEKMEESVGHERREAGDRRLRPPDEATLLPEYTPKDQLEEDSPELHTQLQALTRLTEPSVRVILLPHDSPLIPTGTAALSRDRVRQLLKRSVSVSDRRGYEALMANDQDPPNLPKSFTASPALWEYRMVVLDADGEKTINGATFRYDEALGLSVRKPVLTP
ncbi:CRISPR-associated helicase Cas3' [bacterium]|nr:CRISPR-associated helicase Cas3' [bacterium]